MSNIKKGALVKATDGYFVKGELFIGIYVGFENNQYMVVIGKEVWGFDNAIEIPANLVAQLEELGVE